MEQYDVIIIGGGPAGLVASKVLIAFGKNVAIVEKEKLGGDCTHTGCIPSKTLLKSAQAYHNAKTLYKYGLKYDKFNIDTSKVMEHVRDVISDIYANETPEIFQKDGIDIIEGYAKFISSNIISVNNNKYKAKYFIIATGTRAKILQIAGINDVPYLTNENVFLQQTIPKSLIIIGIGAIGIEMATAFNRLGSTVTLISHNNRILKQNDEELSSILLKQLIKEGIIFLSNTNSTKISSKDNEILLEINQNNTISTIKAQKILLATGRVPNIEIDLEKAGVIYDNQGIKVDRYLKTSVNNIYAIGDVSTKYKFTHIAEQEAITAASNISLPFRKKIDYSNIGWCIYSDPEFAQIGLTHKEALKIYKNNLQEFSFDYKNTDRGYTDVDKIGKIKVSVLKNGKIIGASILGNKAGELIHQIQFAKTFDLTFDKLAKMVYIYPTYSDIIKQPSKKFYISKLLNNSILKFIKKLLGK